MTDIYNDGTYLNANATWHEEDSPWKSRQIINLLESNSINPVSVCEVGCGADEILNRLSDTYKDTSFFGYEISEQAYARCVQKTKRNLCFFKDDIFTSKPEKYNVAMAIDVFEHVEDYLGFLRKFRALAKYKIFHIPLDLTMITLLMPSRIRFRREKFGHLHYFTKETAIRSLEDTGYEIIDHFYTGVSIDRTNSSMTDRMLNIPRKLTFHLNKDIAARTLGGYSLMVLSR